MAVNTATPLRVGSLFSGIGGFDLGLERAGMKTEFFVECEPYCQRVLAKHWPGVPIFNDIREVGVDTLPAVDLLCGGFPCQDLSSAGKQAGIHGERSGLWFEYLRLIRELRPRYVVVENVPQLRKYLGIVVGGLAEVGYDAEWDVISARDVGAPHLRRRMWLVAYPNDSHCQGDGGAQRTSAQEHGPRDDGSIGSVAYPTVIEQGAGTQEAEHARPHGSQLGDGSATGATVGNTDGTSPDPYTSAGSPRQAVGESGWWSTEPDVGRVADGVPARMDRLRALGNALVPQIAEWIGHRVVEYECFT